MAIQAEIKPASGFGRRRFLAGAAGALALTAPAFAAPARRYTIAFANLTEELGARIEGLGFSGIEVRRSFEFAARTLPVDMVYFDNGGEPGRALTNAQAILKLKPDLFIQYNADLEANAEIGGKMQAAGIPVLALNYPVPGAPFYGADNFGAGRLAGVTLGQFAKRDWREETSVAAVAGDLGDLGPAVSARARGIAEGLAQELPGLKPATLDTSGSPLRIEAMLKKLFASLSREKLLLATLDDATALAARAALELMARNNDCVICSQGLDRSIHGGANDKKEIDPANRASPVIGSVAYFVDRYGYDVLPLALKMLAGETLPARTLTKHVLVSAQNIFAIYPPYDMN